MTLNERLPVAILGGGPIGLAAAAHLAQRKIPFQLFEAGSTVGQNLLSWGHVRVFSPWRYNIDKAAASLLLETDWNTPDQEGLPTGKELVEQYFVPLAEHPSIASHIHLNTKVLAVGRKGVDKMKDRGREDLPFLIKVNEGGTIKYHEAKAVIDSSGTWNQPNPIGSGGIHASGEEELRDHIFYGIPHVKGTALDRYKNKNVLVVGGGHSAINVLLDLADVQNEYPETQIHWVLRKENLSSVYGGKENDALEARGMLGTRVEQLVESGKLNIYAPFRIFKLMKNGVHLDVEGELNGQARTIPHIDEIISNTGSRPDLDIIREVRVDLDASLESVFDLAELIDPNIHSCGTVRPHGEEELRHPEKDFYIVGSKSYGRAPTFLMATGYEQVRSVVAHLAGDDEAAKRMELDLPQTGVCNSNPGDQEHVAACCEPGKKEVAKKEEALCCS